MRILILEDEIPASKKLIGHLSEILDEPFTFDTGRTVAAGLKLLAHNHYDLIMSDIKLLDGTSFEIFHTIETKTPIIFCTAYDEHLLDAFRTNGIAYILKPYSTSDIERAMEKYKTLFQSGLHEKYVFNQLREVLESKNRSYKKRLAIKKKEGIKLLQTADISLIQANGDFCSITEAKGKLYSISKGIASISEELNPKAFFRINRSQIVHIEHIEKIEPYSKNRLALKLSGVKDYVITSSAMTKEFRKWLEQ